MKVYKFMPLSGKYYERVVGLLTQGKIYFALPKELNDPFEYSYRFSFGSTLEERIEFMKEDPEFARESEDLPLEHLRELVTKFEQSIVTPIDKKLSEQPFGVFCASRTWSNLVLWSHYADRHLGIAIEIDTHKDSLLSDGILVTYTNKIKTFSFEDQPTIQQLQRTLSRKFTDWTYEKEIRFFASPGIHSISPRAVTSMTFGLEARFLRYRQAKRLIKALKRDLPWCQIYCSIQSDSNEYGLDRVTLDVSKEGYWMLGKVTSRVD